MLTCVNDRYDNTTTNRHETAEEFLAHCRECFGSAPDLTERSYREQPHGRPPVRAGWYDEQGELVLVEAAE